MKVVLLAEAEAELDDSTAWYDARREGLGDELLLAVREALVVISEAPEGRAERVRSGASRAAPADEVFARVEDKLKKQ